MTFAGELGKYIVMYGVFLVMIYALYKSIRRKQIIWIIVLIINNFLLGLYGYFPNYEAVMLPLIYIVKYKNYGIKSFKKEKIKWWGFILIALSVVLSFIFLAPLAAGKPIDVIITSLLIGYIVKLALNNKNKK